MEGWNVEKGTIKKFVLWFHAGAFFFIPKRQHHGGDTTHDLNT